MANYLGIEVHTLIRRAHELGLKMHYRHSPEYCERVVRENYDKMCFRQIDLTFGLSRCTSARVARRLGLKQPAELTERIKQEAIQRLRQSPKDFAAIAAKCKRLRKMDEMRVLSGLPQKTRFPIRRIPHRVYRATWYLGKKYNYYPCEEEPYTMLYDTSTRRNEQTEQYFTQKYGLCFAQAE